jgi:hypothetical protein
VVWWSSSRRRILSLLQPERAHLLEKTSPTARERVGSWRSLVFSLGRLLEAHIFFFLLYFGGIISHTHYSAICIPDLLYYCMRSAIYLNKIRSEVFVAISCVTSLASCCVYVFVYLYHLLVANSTKTIIINPNATQED